MRERIRELQEDVGENRLALIFSAFFASILFIIIFARQHIYPFGDYTLLYVDGDQYASWMRMVNDAISSGESFLYSFRTVLGSGTIASQGYYSMSPFNLLLFFFPHNLVAGIHFIACIKHVCAALTFCVLLNACHEGMVAEKSIFSACYSFIGYMSFFAWNLSWMDGVIALPLVTLGIMKLVKEQRVLLYAVSLAFAVISNFYIGYMICIASLMVYLLVVLVMSGTAESPVSADAAEKSATRFAALRTRFGSLPRYIAASLCGVFLGGFLLVPAVPGLPYDRKETLSDLFRSMHPTLRPADLFSMLFTGRMCSQSANLPVIFSGVLPLLLVAVFFFRKDVARKKKIAAVSVFVFLAFSFWNSMLNMIWHGMSENVWYNYRYSFVCSFFLLMLAFDTLSSVERARLSYYRLVACLFVFCIWMYNDTQSAFYAEDISRDLILLAAGVLILRFLSREGGDSSGEKRGRHRTLARVLLLVFLCANVYRNSVTVMWPDVKDSDSASAFLREMQTAEQAISLIPDDGFHRMEKNWRIGRADAPLLRYNGVSNYTSTENVELLETLRSFGIAHGWKWAYHTENTPLATDALLGIRYLLSKSRIQDSGYEEFAETPNVFVYENKAALPLVMVANELPGKNASDTKISPMEQLNAAYDAFTDRGAKQAEKPVFKEIGSDDHADDSLYYKVFTVEKDFADIPVYLYLDYPVRTIYLYVDDSATTIACNYEQSVYKLGAFPAGTRVQVCLHVPQPVQLVEAEETGTETEQETYEADRTDGEMAVIQSDTQGYFIGEAGGRKAVQAENTVQSAMQSLPAPEEGYRYRFFRLKECLLYAEDVPRVQEIAKTVRERTTDVTVRGNTLDASVVADTDGYAVTTIPYDEAWTIRVDGVRTQPERYLEQFLAVPVSAGEHTIAMQYVPRGFRAGVILTLLSVPVLLLLEIGHPGRLRRRKWLVSGD